MITRLIYPVFLALLLLSVQLQAQDVPKEEYYLTLGTGPVTGLFFPTGGAVQRVFNRETASLGLRMVVEATSGSVENLHSLERGQIDLALVQSDAQYMAYHGQGSWQDEGAFTSLRHVLSLGDQALTILVRPESGMAHLADLRGRILALDGPDGPARNMFMSVLNLRGWAETAFADLRYIAVADQSVALCQEEVDAVILLAAHPVRMVQDAIDLCGVRLLSLDGSVLRELREAAPWLAQTTIPAGLYRGNPYEIRTIGTYTTLVTRVDVEDMVIAALAASLIEALADLRAQHPILRHLDIGNMTQEGGSAPRHAGAAHFLAENGHGGR